MLGLALVALVWFLIFQQSSVTSELLVLPVFGLVWACNTVLGLFVLRGKRWARILLGAEGIFLLAYFYFRQGFHPYCPPWVSQAILRLGWLLVGPLPYVLRWVFIALGLTSVCALFWPRKPAATNQC